MVDFKVEMDIPRPRREVLAWWTGFPDDYRAKDPSEQPHRIRVEERAQDRLTLMTWWRIPPGMEFAIREIMRFHPDGNFDVDVQLPMGVRQHDRFTFEERPTGTHVEIEFTVTSQGLLGTLFRPVWLLYARTSLPGQFAHSAGLCARDAPRLGAPA